MPRPEGVLMMRSKAFFARKHRRFVAISQGGLSTFRCDEHDIAILETRKDLPFEYVETLVLVGSQFEVRRRKPWRHAVIFYYSFSPTSWRRTCGSCPRRRRFERRG